MYSISSDKIKTNFALKDAVFIAVIYDPVNVYLSNLVGTSSLRKDKPKTSLKNLNQTGKITDDQYENCK